MVRARSSLRGRTATATATPAAHDVDFPHLWRQLRAAGWSSKKPSGLINEWSYTSPDGAVTLVGASAVVAHAVETGLLSLDDASENANEDRSEPDEKADEGSGTEAAEATESLIAVDETSVRASQIDTTVELTQRTLDALIDGGNAEVNSDQQRETALFESPTYLELSQAVVARAFDLSQRDLQTPETEREAIAALERMSGASGMESEEEGSEEQQQSVSRRRSRRRVKLDVNFLDDDENPDLYNTLESDESDGVSDDERDPEGGQAADDNVFITDDDAVQLDEAFLRSLQPGNDALNKKAIKEREQALREMPWTDPSSTFEVGVCAYPGMDDLVAQPVQELRDVYISPLLTLFYFMPKSLWVQISLETNRYGLQQVSRRAESIQARQHPRKQETLKQIKRRLKSKPSYQPHEILHVIGLLVARAISSHDHFNSHWSMTDDGAVPAGIFGRFMSRNRCHDILRDLHFVDNTDANKRDKLWKLRPIVDKLQARFLSGWTLPAVLSFDEGVLPATSKRNTTRMFMPDKPHRFELYAAKRDASDSDESAFDHKTGAAAVIRNLKIVIQESSRRQAWHAVVVDRFYSSILLAVELLTMGIYVIGTVMTNRLGFDQKVKESRQTRPASIPRGTFKFSRSVQVPQLVALHWWDRKPVHYLCTGAVMTDSTIARNVKQVGRIVVPCLAVVNDYQRWMSGVDVHDQLRLQRYSLQLSTRFKKY